MSPQDDGIESWLRRVLWQSPVSELSSVIETAAKSGVFADPSSIAVALAVLADPSVVAGDAGVRLRRLALALLAAGEHRLQAHAWRAALKHGIDKRSGYSRMLDAAQADGNWLMMIEAASALSTLPQSRANLPTLVANAIGKLLDASGLLAPHTAVAIVRTTGLHIFPDILQHVNAVDFAEGVVAAADLPLSQRVAAVSALALKGHGALARALVAEKLSRELGRRSTLLLDAVFNFAEGRSETVNAQLDHLSSTVADGDLESGLLVLWAFITAGNEHPSLHALVATVARRPDLFDTLRLVRAMTGASSGPFIRLLSALKMAGADAHHVFDLTIDSSDDIEVDEARDAIVWLETDSSDRRGERIAQLARRLTDSVKIGAAEAAQFCRRHSSELLLRPSGAATFARALTAIHDWQGALDGWAALLSLQPNAHWAVGRAYYAAAKVNRRDLAVRYKAQIDLSDRSSHPALLTVASGACILEDFELALLCLEEYFSLPADSEIRQMDRTNNAGRLWAALTGSSDQLFQNWRAVPAVPAEAPSPRVLVIDPGFATDGGHNFTYSLFAVEFLAQEAGMDRGEIWVCARKPDHTVGHPDQSRLRCSLHQVLEFNPRGFRDFPISARSIGNISNALLDDLSHAFARDDLNQVEIVYCHSMKAFMAIGLAKWIAERFGGRRVAVIIGIIEVDYLNEGEVAAAACGSAYETACRILREAPGVHLTVYAETSHAVRHLSDAIGPLTTVHNIPYLAASLAGPASSAHVAFSRHTVTIGLVGGSRRERGLDLFPELMLALAAQPDIRWIVQLSRKLAEQMDAAFPAYLQWAVDQGICTWYQDRMETDAYHQALREMDAVLMPYRERYAQSGSGVFYEAIQLERYLVVPQGTFMADVLTNWSYPSEIMNAASVPAALRSLRRVLKRREAIAGEMMALRGLQGDRLPVGHFRNLVRDGLRHVRG